MVVETEFICPSPDSRHRRVGVITLPPRSCSFPVINRKPTKMVPEFLGCARKWRRGTWTKDRQPLHPKWVQRKRSAFRSARLLLMPQPLQRLLDMAREHEFGRALVLQRDLGNHLALGRHPVDGDAQRLQRVLHRIHDGACLVAAM